MPQLHLVEHPHHVHCDVLSNEVCSSQRDGASCSVSKAHSQLEELRWSLDEHGQMSHVSC